MLQEKDQQIAELNQLINERAVVETSLAVPENVDLDAFEAELRKERQQLEVDRGKLTKELEQLRARNVELDEATREMEMEMSKERSRICPRTHSSRAHARRNPRRS